jgi:hypothetical protein
MPNHKNMFGTFYGNGSRSGNSTSSRGMQTKRSTNGQASIGNGNLVPRRKGNGGGKPNGGGLEKGRPHWFGNLINLFINPCQCVHPVSGVPFQTRQGRHPDCAAACAAKVGEMSGGNGQITRARRRR